MFKVEARSNMSLHRLFFISMTKIGHKWRRYEREALALKNISPEIQLTFFDAFYYFWASIFHDSKHALNDECFFKEIGSIFIYRSAQFWGSYSGSRPGREISFEMKQRYFYPRG